MNGRSQIIDNSCKIRIYFWATQPLFEMVCLVLYLVLFQTYITVGVNKTSVWISNIKQLLTHDDTWWHMMTLCWHFVDTLPTLTTFTDALITTVTTVIICIRAIIQRYTPSIGTGELWGCAWDYNNKSASCYSVYQWMILFVARRKESSNKV